MLAGVLAVVVAVVPGQGRGNHGAQAAGAGMGNIDQFLSACPTNDARYQQFRNDFEIRREGVAVGAIPCSEPTSAMPIAQYTDELIIAQAVRTIYYMEGGRTVSYPWTSGTFYDWMKSKIGGFDIRANGSYCCEMFDGKWFVVVSSQSDLDRNPDRKWRGLSDRIAILGHETRHVDGFPHVGGCPLFPTASFGCDQSYDESNLSPYGIQWWLNAKWLSGEINVGYSCLSENAMIPIANAHLNSANNDFGRRFADGAPPVLTMPAQPGGPCLGGGATSSPTQTPGPTSTIAPTPTAAPTPSATPIPTQSPSPTVAPSGLIQGDVDCDGFVNAVDALKLIRYAVHLGVGQNEPCPDLGSWAGATWGDVDCGGDISSVDALKVLRYGTGQPVPQSEPCADIGAAWP